MCVVYGKYDLQGGSSSKDWADPRSGRLGIGCTCCVYYLSSSSGSMRQAIFFVRAMESCDADAILPCRCHGEDECNLPLYRSSLFPRAAERACFFPRSVRRPAQGRRVVTCELEFVGRARRRQRLEAAHHKGAHVMPILGAWITTTFSFRRIRLNGHTTGALPPGYFGAREGTQPPS